MMLKPAAIITAILAVATTATPTSMPERRRIVKRWEEGVDCVSSIVGVTTKGLLFAHDSEGLGISCDEVGGVSTDGWGATCYSTSGNSDEIGDIIKCPADPEPTRNPDGSEAATVADGFIQTWCQNAAPETLPGQWASIVGCLIYGYYEANGDPIAQEESGAMAVCDTIFSGLCTWFTGVAPEIAAGMDKACIDDPNSNACAFGGPSK